MAEANGRHQRHAPMKAGYPTTFDALSDHAPSEIDETAPGYAWKNRRAADEYEKMSEMVLDKSFSLGRCFAFQWSVNAYNVQQNSEILCWIV